MILDDLLNTTGEWLRGTGPESDVVVSSRIRLARNLADFPFTNRASPMQKGEIEALIRERLAKINGVGEGQLQYLQVHNLNALEREFLRERQLISREHVGAEGPRGVAFEKRETRSLMVNEEDHLRLQVLRSGFVLDEAWEDSDKLDDLIEERVAYAYSEEFGYLTACPTNVGTGMRSSVMLHLPALHYTKQLEKVFRALQKINLAVRGLYGEGTRASGDFYQISNQVTLGKSEQTILREIKEVIPQIITYERVARQALLSENKMMVADKVARAYGTLRAATMMTTEETMELLSTVRLGIQLNLIEDLKMAAVNELFLQTQPAHLQRLRGAALEGDERNIARAAYLRQKLTNGQASKN
jgi:protein arginine kinase